MRHCNQSLISPYCASQSVGTANQLFVSLIQTLLAAQCSISPPWPQDYGPVALEHGKVTSAEIVIKILNIFDIVLIRIGRIRFHCNRCW